MNNNNNVSWIEIMSAEIIRIRGIYGKYEEDKLKAILEYLTVPPQEGESVRIPILKDGEYTIIARTMVVKDYEYNSQTDDLDEYVEEIILKKTFRVANDRLYRNDKLAVIISSNYGAGWYTWLQEPLLLTHPLIVEKVEKKAPITLQWLEETFHISLRGCSEDSIEELELKIAWVPRGCAFRITEYDGIEYIELFDPSEYIMA